MKALAVFSLAIGVLLSQPALAAGKMMTRNEAVEACREEMNGKVRGKLPACVTAKLDAARAAGLHPKRTGKPCRYSSLGATC